MKLLNDGKYQLIKWNIFNYKIELDYYISDYCTNRVSDYSRLIFTFWNKNRKIDYKKIWYFKYNYKPNPRSLSQMKLLDNDRSK